MKRRCRLGKNCPYQHQHQHIAEFHHDDEVPPSSPAKSPKKGAGGGSGKGRSKAFEGTGFTLGSSSSGERLGSAAFAGEGRVFKTGPKLKKKTKACTAAAQAALSRASDSAGGHGKESV